MELTLGSLFDGISGFPLAGARLGIKTLWGSEIEPFPIKVSKIRFPDMKQLGDITKINGAEIEPVDIVTGGSPCQDLSVAGKRAGLAGERSGLFMEQIRVVKEMRERDRKAGKPIRPRFMVWENVPGAFSSNKGEDFRAVIEETARIADETVTIPRPPGGAWNTCGAIMADGWSIAWRVLDAQYWGVPQRRRRIFLVADFGGQSAPEILFKREGLSRHIAEGEEAGEGAAANAERCFRETGQGYWGEAVMTYQKVTGPLMANSHPGSYTGQDAYTDMLVAKPLSAQPQLRHREDMDTLITQHYSVRRLTPLECERLQGFPDGWTDIPGQTEASKEELEFWRDVWLTWDKTQAEDAEKVKPRTDKSILKWLKNPTSDSAQYKALGNSVAVPCVEYVLEGIKSII